MKALYTLLASALISQAAAAGEVSCNITRTHKYNSRDVATHSVAFPFDSAWRRDGVLVEAEIRSHLLPTTGQTIVRFGLTDRRSLTTELSLQTFALYPYQYVSGDSEMGSISGAPNSVVNRFDLSNTPYSMEISCDVQN